jgi:hypothetical protein
VDDDVATGGGVVDDGGVAAAIAANPTPSEPISGEGAVAGDDGVADDGGVAAAIAANPPAAASDQDVALAKASAAMTAPLPDGFQAPGAEAFAAVRQREFQDKASAAADAMTRAIMDDSSEATVAAMMEFVKTIRGHEGDAADASSSQTSL